MKKLLLYLVIAVSLIFNQTAWAGIDFDGTDDLVNFGSNASVDDAWTTGGTFLTYVRIDTYDATSRRLYDKTQNNIIIVLSGTTKIIRFTFQWDLTGGSWSWNNKITDATIHSLCVTYTADSILTVPTLYIDGTSYSPDSSTQPTGTAPATDAASTFYLANTAAGNRAFDGLVQEVALYKGKVFTAAEVTQWNNSKLRGIPLSMGFANLSLYAPMDEGVVGVSADLDTCWDLSGNANNGNPDNGANNTGLAWTADTVLNYPSGILMGQ